MPVVNTLGGIGTLVSLLDMIPRQKVARTHVAAVSVHHGWAGLVPRQNRKQLEMACGQAAKIHG
jgi:hypothetical protein